jgi:hypothetical protein
MNQHTAPGLYGHEVVLFRTRTEIVTDKRLLIDGTTYAFDQIETVHVARLRYFVPLQFARLLALGGMILLGWMAFNSLRDQAFLGMSFFGLVAAGLGSFAFLSKIVIPTHSLRLQSDGKSIYFMYDNGPNYLRQVEQAIQRAAHQRRHYPPPDARRENTLLQ